MDSTAPETTKRGDPTLNVEVRVVEEGGNDANDSVLATSKGEVALLKAAQGWVIEVAVLVSVMVIAGIYVGAHIGSGWVPADDGILGQGALRVMHGQLPHRDFAEIYTGGLGMLHALAFRVFGVNLMSLRICVFLFFLAWIPAVYFIALRFTSVIGAGMITLLAVAWSFPNYPAAMPSWYNLFFATFGAAALLRYLEARRARWLIAAGLCGGVSLLIKVIGAYYIAGVLLFLAFLEQSDAQSDAQGDVQTDERNGDGRSSSRVAGAGKYAVPYLAFSAASLLLFWTTVLYLFRSRLGNGELFHFLMPATVLVGLILFGERYVRNVAAKRRFLRLLKLTVPFGFGVLVPVLVFLAPYSRSGSIGQFFSGVTSSAVARSAGLAVLRPMSIDKSIFALALAGLIAAAMYRREFQGRAVGAAVALGLAVALAKAQTTGGIVTSVWYSAAGLTPLVVVAGAVFVLAGQKEAGESRRKRQQVMALISLAAMCSLVQYPFAAPIYLCYALPLTILAALAIVTSARKQAGTIIFSAVAGFYLVFAVVTLVPDYIYELTHTVGKMDRMKSLRAGGLQIEGAAFFDDLAQFLRARSPNGQMYAGNDCPELYFLSGRQNVTRDDGGATTEDVLKALQSDDLNLVVINEHPFFPSAQMSPEVTGAVTARFPNSVRFGAFRVFWKKN